MRLGARRCWACAPPPTWPAWRGARRRGWRRWRRKRRMLDPTLEAEGLGPTPFSEALAGDWAARRGEIAGQLGGARVLVVGAAGTIGGAAVRQLLGFGPARLELVDLDENGLARLARDIPSRRAGGGAAI